MTEFPGSILLNKNLGKLMIVQLLSFGILYLIPHLAVSNISPFKKEFETESNRITLSSKKSNINRNTLYFEQNIGQNQSRFLYTSSTPSYNLALTRTSAVLTLYRHPNTKNNHYQQLIQLQLQPLNTNPAAEIKGLLQYPGTSSYFTSEDRSKWIRGAKHYKAVRYSDIYPGVDLEYYGHNLELEYDFIVKPGYSPDPIRVAFKGIDKITIDPTTGNALLQFGENVIVQKKPYAYQIIQGKKIQVDAEYFLPEAEDNESTPQLGFRLSRWNPGFELVIDPILSYSSLMGGDLFDSGGDIALDDSGNVYMISRSFSPGVTDIGSTIASCNYDCQSNVIVSKFAPDGSTLLWKAVISGSGDEDGRGIAVDRGGNTYIAGWTNSEDFPLINASDSLFEGLSEGFLSKINPSGTDLLFSSYFGSEGSEMITSLALDGKGHIYIGGRSSLPVYNETSAGIFTHQVETDGFVAKFSTDGTNRIYRRRLGGSSYDSVEAIAVTHDGQLFATGTTDSENFPLRSALYLKRKGVGDAFLCKLTGSSGKIMFSTLFGGNLADTAKAIDLDSNGNPTIAGMTTSVDLPLISPLYSKNPGHYPNWDGFISKFSNDGKSLLYSSYLGGSKGDYLNGLDLDAKDNMIVTGHTLSEDFPIREGISATLRGGSDLFVSKIRADGKKLLYSSFMGGNSDESFAKIAVDQAGNTFITGLSFSDDFTVSNRLQAKTGMTGAAFISKISNAIEHAIPNNTWHIISLPRMPAGQASIKAVFSDDIIAEYKRLWYVYKFDSELKKYRLLELNDQLERGAAYWILQNTGTTVTVDIPEGSYAAAADQPAPCPVDKSCVEKPLQIPAGEDGFHLIGNPFPYPIEWNNVHLLTDDGTCSSRQGGCSLAEARKAGLISDTGWIYEQGRKAQIGAGDILQPWQGFWIKSYRGLDNQNPRIVFSD